MGVAGGLVPSPSALVVLLGAIALGRTWFGITLVLCYGIGMAATLTAAGILLVTEAGGRCTDMKGGPHKLTGSDLLTDNGAVHEQILELFGGDVSTCQGEIE